MHIQLLIEYVFKMKYIINYILCNICLQYAHRIYIIVIKISISTLLFINLL